MFLSGCVQLNHLNNFSVFRVMLVLSKPLTVDLHRLKRKFGLDERTPLPSACVLFFSYKVFSTTQPTTDMLVIRAVRQRGK